MASSQWGEPPLFSVIMTNYNNEPWLERAIGSVLNQTMKRWELVIIDDGSTDNSIEVIEKFSDPRIRLIAQQKNTGCCRAFRNGITHIRSAYFGWLDSDDALLPHALETMLDAHERYPQAGYVYSQFMYCDENLTPVRLGYCKEIPEGKTNLEVDGVSHFKTFKKCFYDKTGGFDPEIMFAEDKDISFRMEEVGNLAFVDEILYLYRVLPNSESHAPRKRKISLLSFQKAKVNAVQRRFDAACKAMPSVEHDPAALCRFPKIDQRPEIARGVSVILIHDKQSSVQRTVQDLIQQGVTEILVADCASDGEVAYEFIDLPVFYMKLPESLSSDTCKKFLTAFARTKEVVCY